MRTPMIVLACLAVVASACSKSPASKPAVAAATEIVTATPADAFFARLHALCGKSYAGKLAIFNESDLAGFGGAAVMQVRGCTANEIRIPFHVGENRSRTWVITRMPDGLRLKHDHRHDDGSADELTMYGGESTAAAAGSAGRQEFPADAQSKAMFVAAGLAVSVDNVWAIEVEPGRQFAYELKRPNRHFRVEFDLARPVAAPPPPWASR